MKRRGTTEPRRGKAKPGPVITRREVGRLLRFMVALVQRKRRRMGWSVELCAAWAGMSPDMWRRTEKRRRRPGGETLVQMIVASNMTLWDVVEAAKRRKIRLLRVFAGVGQLSQ